jgi:hypothetical protein
LGEGVYFSIQYFFKNKTTISLLYTNFFFQKQNKKYLTLQIKKYKTRVSLPLWHTINSSLTDSYVSCFTQQSHPISESPYNCNTIHQKTLTYSYVSRVLLNNQILPPVSQSAPYILVSLRLPSSCSCKLIFLFYFSKNKNK